MLEISQASIDLIVAEEVSSKDYYIRHYQHPEWPGGASGVTIGIGYDMGYSTRDQIAADWSAHVDAGMLAVMQRCAGVTAGNAHALLGQVRASIVIPWDAAMDVFLNRDMPKWTATCASHLPNFGELAPDCKGALVSLAYNRGPSFDAPGERNSEMRAIKAHMIAKDYAAIPGEFRMMKRLWPNVGGLQRRREHEAVLFEHGLGVTTSAPPPRTPAPATPPPRRPAPMPAPHLIATVAPPDRQQSGA